MIKNLHHQGTKFTKKHQGKSRENFLVQLGALGVLVVRKGVT